MMSIDLKSALKVVIGTSIASLLSTASPAVVISKTLFVTASNFVFSYSSNPVVAPFDPVQGTFTYTFDNAADFSHVTTGISASGFNLAFNGSIEIGYFALVDLLTISTNAGISSLDYSNEGFGFFVTDASTHPLIGSTFSYSNQGEFYTSYDVASFEPSVPEPATWAMMLGGFGLVGAVTRRRRARISFG